jgi:hypothetical protein
MSFSVFTIDTHSRVGRTYETKEAATQDRDARNAKAESLGIKTRYEVAPYSLQPGDGKEVVRAQFTPLPLTA